MPSGRIVELPETLEAPAIPTTDASVIFGSARALVEKDLALDPSTLSLADFHALRAIATHLGWLAEDEIEFECRNCNHTIAAKPCASLPLGPFADAELDDEELDMTLEVDVNHDVPELGTTIGFLALTLRDVEPLHRALAKKDLRITPAVVKAMGIVALGDELDSSAIARTLARCDDRAFGAVTNLFLAVHYPPRLFAPIVCSECGARNDVDAPYDREFPPYEDTPDETAKAFPSFEEFDALACRIAEPLLERAPGERVTLVVEGGVPACDDGGDPLLGSYVPAHEGDARSPSISAEITLYYLTFAAMWHDDGAYDFEAEIHETVEHELEHHEAHLIGHDPKDEEERDEIAREAGRVLGKRALARASATGLAADIAEFWRRTWPVWFVALIGVIIAILASR